MKETKNKTHPISFVGSPVAKAGVPFDSQMVEGIHVTFFMDNNNEDIMERVNGAFDILFGEVLRIRDMNRCKGREKLNYNQ